MKCTCTSHYERLEESQQELSSIPEDDKDLTSEKEEQISFYNDDGSFQSVVVEKNLCSGDLCQLLALKNRVPKSATWSIVEIWVEFGLERVLEDHEDVLSAYRDMKAYSRYYEFKYVFRKEMHKYDFFQRPEVFFPQDMVDVDNYFNPNGKPALQNMILKESECPRVISMIWISEPMGNTLWTKAFLLLRDKKLYISYELQQLVSFLRIDKLNRIGKDTSPPPNHPATTNTGVRILANLCDVAVYRTLNAKNQFRAPTEWGLCLRRTGLDLSLSSSAAGGGSPGGLGTLDAGGEGGGLLLLQGDSQQEELDNSLICLACESERARCCWFTAMRLAKYGKQLRENYRAFKNKQADSINPKDYNSYTVPNESVRSRVAMDFTGSVGRIVDDPKEAKAIAVAEGYSWKRRWRPGPGARPPLQQDRSSGGGGGGGGNAPQAIMETGVHTTQPWFHAGMTRDQAGALVSRHGTVDGVFLVRDSRSNPGAYVLTYKCGGKVLHAQIHPVADPIRDGHVYSLDSGVTKFYDLLQLVEFYQLNAGCLPTRLTHYVVQSSTYAPIGGSHGNGKSALTNGNAGGGVVYCNGSGVVMATTNGL